MSLASILRVVTAALIPAAVFLAAAPACAKDWRTIRIGFEGAYPPFNYLDARGELRGFEVDLARAVCERAKAKCELLTGEWEQLVPGLLAGMYDAVFSSVAITPEARRLVDFSDRYYATPAVFVARKDSGVTTATPEDLRGKAVGAKAGTVYARRLEERYAPYGAMVKLYVTQGEANQDLASGRLDAVLADKVALMTWLEKSPEGACCRVAGPDLPDPAAFGAAVRKGDADLKELINRAIREIRADGTYERINARHFPFSLR